jgi:hypothetical protein
LLHSADGRAFRELDGAEALVGRVASHRAVMEFNGWLFTAPVGRPHSPNETGAAVVLVSEDPATRPWRIACEPGFGDSTNSTVMEMCVYGDHLYVGTLNWKRGYQVWRTAAVGRPPFRWTRMLTDGAGRGPLNQVALSMCVFRGALYVGSGIQGGGYDTNHDVGPAAAELVRYDEQGRWEVVVGAPRRTGKCLKFPVSGLEPGFGNLFAGYFWRMCEYQNRLYLGTYDWSIFAPYLPGKKLPPPVVRQIRAAGLGFDVVERRGGFDMWCSADGDTWTSVTRTGFGNPYNFGVRTMQATPHGLYVGTANPFGPEVAGRTPAGWAYCPHDAGGLEVWLGHPRMKGDVNAGA